MAIRKNRVLGSLVTLMFDPRQEIAWRAVEAMGLAVDLYEDRQLNRTSVGRLVLRVVCREPSDE